ncbi:MAG: hypothetical protein R3F42_07920 [Pseudomonadota bacterium]
MSVRGTLSAVAIALTLIAFFPYIRSILAGTTRPHVFSWLIWGITTCLVFLAQLAGGGGIGVWPIGVSGIVTLQIALLAWIRRADVTITVADRLFFGAALAALPLWYLTADPLWAVAVLTLVDVLGFGPTVRKAYVQPGSESLTFFALFALRNGLVILALERYSLTTVLYPAVIGVACLLLIALTAWRRMAGGR